MSEKPDAADQHPLERRSRLFPSLPIIELARHAAAVGPPMETPPSLPAIELARLAAALDPLKCRDNPKAAIKYAFEFYNAAFLWTKAQASRDPLDVLLDSENMGIHHFADPIWQERFDHSLEETLLHFRPADVRTDPVREFFGVKTPKAIKVKFRKFFIARARVRGESDEQGLIACDDFLESVKRQDGSGKTYYAFDVWMLDRIKTFERQVKEKGGRKAIETKQQTAAKRASKRPAPKRAERPNKKVKRAGGKPVK